jgi:hypothetical protein
VRCLVAISLAMLPSAVGRNGKNVQDLWEQSRLCSYPSMATGPDFPNYVSWRCLSPGRNWALSTIRRLP